jgi:hypothetical protein
MAIYIIIVLAIPISISIGELLRGKLLSLTLTSVLAERKQLARGFTKLVLLKLGIFMSLLATGSFVVFIFLAADSSRLGRMKGVGGILLLFFLLPLKLFSEKYSAFVRLEKRRGHKK